MKNKNTIDEEINISNKFWIVLLIALLFFLYFIPKEIAYPKYKILDWILLILILILLPYLVFKTLESINYKTYPTKLIGICALSILIVGPTVGIFQNYRKEKELNEKGMGGSGQNALDQMKQIEKQLINKGFNNETLQKALNLKYELLKLQKATQEQGEQQKRQAETNKREFMNQSKALPAGLQDYLNSIEILNRQSLPLRSNFEQKVQEYFKSND